MTHAARSSHDEHAEVDESADGEGRIAVPSIEGLTHGAATDQATDYALHALASRFELPLTREHPLVVTLAELMDNAALDAAQDWLDANAAALANVVSWPRECWCGQWPALGTDCDYHGRCICLVPGGSGTGPRALRWRPAAGPIGGSPGARCIPLPGNCAVHPADHVPVTVADRLYEHLRAHEFDDARPWGRPQTDRTHRCSR